MSKRHTAEDLAWQTYKENCPTDWRKLEHLRRNYTRAERLDWAQDDASKQYITRAANKLLNLLF